MADGEGSGRRGWWSPKEVEDRTPTSPPWSCRAPTGSSWGGRPVGMLSPNPYRIVTMGPV